MKSYTDIEQSKRLTEILQLESADSHYVKNTHDFMGNPIDGKWSHPKYGNPNSKYAHYVVQNFSNYEIIPCWSLVALLKVIPKYIKDYNVFRIDIGDNDFAIWYDDISNGCVNESLPDITMESSIDACVEMIIKLYEQHLI